MGLFFAYILKSSLCLVAFYLFYKVLLSRETFYRFNRFALLSLMAFSAVLPLVQITLEHPSEVGQTIVSVEDWLVEVVSVEEAPSVLTWPQVLVLIYLLGVLFFVLRQAYSVVRLLQLLRKGRRVDAGLYLSDAEGIHLIAVDEKLPPFSWMTYVVVSENDLCENVREILLHECAHIRHHHSWDLLVAEVCILLQWFNPAAWLLKQELQTIHEYEADDCVLREGIDARHYQLLLIKKAVGTRLYSMANNLNHSNLKKRITMMMKRKSNPWARLKYAYVLPLAAIAVTAFARPEVQNASSEISAVKVNDLVGNLVTNLEEKFTLPDSNIQLPQDSIYEYGIVETVPVFPGGEAGMMKYLSNNIKYPVEAQEAGIVGRVFTRFIINEDGSVSDVDVVRSVHPLLDAEAVRVVKAMPKWTPGKAGGKAVKVRYSLPLIFRLQGESTPQTNTPSANNSKTPSYPGGDKALYSFLAQHMRYPTDAQEAGVQGRAIVELTIAADGSMVNPHVTSSVHPLLEKEALRVVNMLQRWNPAVNENGQAVSATITLPFSFVVADANGNISQRDKSVETENEIVVVGQKNG